MARRESDARKVTPIKQLAGVPAEIGGTGLNHWGGQLAEEWLPQLRGQKATAIYQEMRDNDPVVGAMLFAVEMLVRQVPWVVKPASDSPDDRERAEFVDGALNDMEQPWSETLAGFMEMLPFGWSAHEEVYKIRAGEDPDPHKTSRFDDGAVGWRKFPIRAQNTLLRWEFDESGDWTAFVQSAPPDYKVVTIPRDRLLLFRSGSKKGSPEGRSVLRNAYRPWYFKKRLEEIEGIGIERDLAGLPVAWAPIEILSSDADDAQKAMRSKLETLVRNLRRDEKEGLVFPLAYDENGHKLYDLSLLASSGGRSHDVGASIQRYDSRILMVAIADFIVLGHEKVGSFSLNSSKTALFATAIGAWLDVVADNFNRLSIPRLGRLNGWPMDGLPRLEYGDIESVDLRELGDFISKLAGAMPDLLVGDEDLENWIRKQAGWPERPEGEAGTPMNEPEPEPRPEPEPEPEPDE
jgi:hypothetical protein